MQTFLKFDDNSQRFGLLLQKTKLQSLHYDF